MSSRGRKCVLRVVLRWLILFLVTATATSDTMLVDDFEDGHDDGWIHAPRSGKPSVYEVISGEYVLKSDTRLFGPTGVSAYLDESSEAGYADGFWRTTVRADLPNSNPLLFLRVQDQDLSRIWKFYGFVSAVSDSSFGIIKFDSNAGGFPTTLDRGVIPGFEVGEDWVLEAGTVGNQLSFKAWAAGEPEPRFPQLTAIDSSFASGGFAIDVGVAPGVGSDLIAGSFDDIYFRQPVVGDFDFDQIVTASDIDALSEGIRSRSRNNEF